METHHCECTQCHWITHFEWLILCHVNFTPIKIKSPATIDGLTRTIRDTWSLHCRNMVERDCLCLGHRVGRFAAEGGLILIQVASWRGMECATFRGSKAGKTGKSEQAWFVWGTWISLQGWWAKRLWSNYYGPGGVLRVLHQLGHFILSITRIFVQSCLWWHWACKKVIFPVLNGACTCMTT